MAVRSHSHPIGALPARRLVLTVLASALALSGCAGAGNSPAVQPAGGIGTLSGGVYQLSAEEKGLDCRRLTGRMQVRMLAARGAEYKVGPSGTSSAIRSMSSTALFTDTAANAAERAARERPMLDAYNRRLVELGCASFDVEKELAARPSAPPPSPTIPAPGKAQAAER